MTEEVWAFGVSDLVATVGGNLGLFLGTSVMAVYDEIVEMAMKMV